MKDPLLHWADLPAATAAATAEARPTLLRQVTEALEVDQLPGDLSWTPRAAQVAALAVPVGLGQR